MPSLKEIRARINSVKGTLKITSAMRMISSAKLHAALNAVESIRPYRESISDILGKVIASCPAESGFEIYSKSGKTGKKAVVLVTSNQKMCGSFNVNVIKKFEEMAFDPKTVEVFGVGKNGLQYARKAGFLCNDWCNAAEKPDYDIASQLCDSLLKGFESGTYSDVVIIRSYLKSKSSQIPVEETFLPIVFEGAGEKSSSADYLCEPSSAEMAKALLPQVMRMRIFTALQDSYAAQHAARMLAMQIASDNAKDLIDELSLLHNKLRQQEITNELLDLAGGRSE